MFRETAESPLSASRHPKHRMEGPRQGTIPTSHIMPRHDVRTALIMEMADPDATTGRPNRRHQNQTFKYRTSASAYPGKEEMGEGERPAASIARHKVPDDRCL